MPIAEARAHGIGLLGVQQAVGGGSGDAILAGYLAARYEGRAPDQCLRFGVACGAESTARLGAGLIDPREARRLMGGVELTVVDLPAEVA